MRRWYASSLCVFLFSALLLTACSSSHTSSTPAPSGAAATGNGPTPTVPAPPSPAPPGTAGQPASSSLADAATAIGGFGQPGASGVPQPGAPIVAPGYPAAAPGTFPPVVTPQIPGVPANPSVPGAVPVVPVAPAVDPATVDRVKAQVGVGIKGRSLDQYEGVIVTPAKTLFAARERIVFDIAIPQALALYKATNGEAPKSHDEFMQKIVTENNIQLPKLPDGHRYVFDPETEQLMVERPKKAP